MMSKKPTNHDNTICQVTQIEIGSAMRVANFMLVLFYASSKVDGQHFNSVVEKNPERAQMIHLLLRFLQKYVKGSSEDILEYYSKGSCILLNNKILMGNDI